MAAKSNKPAKKDELKLPRCPETFFSFVRATVGSAKPNQQILLKAHWIRVLLHFAERAPKRPGLQRIPGREEVAEARGRLGRTRNLAGSTIERRMRKKAGGP